MCPSPSNGEPRELASARRLLAAAEVDLRAASSLAQLDDGLARLLDVVESGRSPYAQTALNLATSYAGRVCEQIAGLLSADAGIPEPELEHWFRVITTFDPFAKSLPADAARLKVTLVRRLIDRYYEGHGAEKKRHAIEELEKLVGGR